MSLSLTQTGLLTSSGVSTNSPQASVSSILSATATSSNASPTSTRGNYNYRSPRLRVGPIVGGVVAVVALILIFTFLLLKHRASRREIRLRAEIDPSYPTSTCFNLHTREGLGRHVSVNDDGSRSEISRPTASVYSSQIVPQANASLKRARTNYTVHPPIHDERIHFASECNSNPNLQAGGLYQSNSSYDLITNGAITEEMTTHTTHTLTYIPSPPGSPNETHLSTDFTNISTNSEYALNSAPPAYESLPTPISRVNSSQPKP